MQKKDTKPERKTFMDFPFYHLRGKDVISDNDAAVFFGINSWDVWDIMREKGDSFKGDCVFEMTKGEFQDWLDQFVAIPDQTIMTRPVYFFTEFGLFLLSIFLDTKVSRQFAMKIGKVMFSPRTEDGDTIVARVMEEMDSNDTLKELWSVYRKNKVPQTTWEEKSEN